MYLDLLTGWRDAWELGCAARDNALELISSAVDGTVVVWNTLTHNRTDVVTARLDEPLGDGVRVIDADGNESPALVEHDGRSVSWLARDIPSLGWRAYRPGRRVGADGLGSRCSGTEISQRPLPAAGRPGTGRRGLVADRRRPRAARRRQGRQRAGRLRRVPGTPATRARARGICCPRGRWSCSSADAAESVQATTSALGERLVVRGRIGSVLRYTQTLTLWHGVARVDCRTTIDEFTGEDQLLRLRWPCPVPGAMPVSEVGDAVDRSRFRAAARTRLRAVRRHREASRGHWTTRPTAGSGCRRRCGSASATRVRAVSVAEVVVADGGGVGAAGPRADGRAGPRRRHRHVQQRRQAALRRPRRRLQPARRPDRARRARRERLHRSGVGRSRPAYTDELKRQLDETGSARVWVPAAAPLATTWLPGADLRGVADTAGAGRRRRRRLDASRVASVVEDLADAEISVDPAGARGRRAVRRRGPSRCSTAGCPASPSTPTAPCTRR